MKTGISIVLVVLVLFNAELKNQKTKVNSFDVPASDTLMVYKSTAQDVAEIEFIFWQNNSFKLSLNILAQPMTEDEDKLILLYGVWEKVNNWTRIKFTKDDIIVEAIFDEDYSEPGEFIINDDKTVDIDTELEYLMIWGVSCRKEK